MKTPDDMLHSCEDCLYSCAMGEWVYCTFYPKHERMSKLHFCGQWSHTDNYEREYNQSKNQLTVTE